MYKTLTKYWPQETLLVSTVHKRTFNITCVEIFTNSSKKNSQTMTLSTWISKNKLQMNNLLKQSVRIFLQRSFQRLNTANIKIFQIRIRFDNTWKSRKIRRLMQKLRRNMQRKMMGMILTMIKLRSLRLSKDFR